MSLVYVFDNHVAGGALLVSVVNGALKEVCSAKVRPIGEKAGQAWRLHVHPQDPSRAAYLNRSGEVKWSLSEIEVPYCGAVCSRRRH